MGTEPRTVAFDHEPTIAELWGNLRDADHWQTHQFTEHGIWWVTYFSKEKTMPGYIQNLVVRVEAGRGRNIRDGDHLGPGVTVLAASKTYDEKEMTSVSNTALTELGRRIAKCAQVNWSLDGGYELVPIPRIQISKEEVVAVMHAQGYTIDTSDDGLIEVRTYDGRKVTSV